MILILIRQRCVLRESSLMRCVSRLRSHACAPKIHKIQLHFCISKAKKKGSLNTNRSG